MSANVQRLFAMMTTFGLDAVIVSSPENVAYLSGFQGQRPYCFREFNIETAVLVTRENTSPPCLVIPANDAGIICRNPVSIDDVYTYGTIWTRIDVNRSLTPAEARFQAYMTDKEHHVASCGSALVSALRKRGLDKGRIGLESSSLTPRTCAMLHEALPGLELHDAHDFLRYIRMVKTPSEIEALRDAGIRNERSVLGVLEHVREGVSETELTQLYLDGLATEGGIFEYWNTAAGPESAMAVMSPGHLQPRSDYRLKKGDLYRYDGGSVFNRYHADAGGCVILGEPNPDQLRIFNALTAGIDHMRSIIRPGVLPSKILEEAIACVQQSGLPEFSKSCFFCGHGIGLEARDYPIFTKPVATSAPFLPGTLDLPLEENMVISIELPYGELGLGGFQVEYTLVVTSTGTEKLYPHSRELRIC